MQTPGNLTHSFWLLDESIRTGSFTALDAWLAAHPEAVNERISIASDTPRVKSSSLPATGSLLVWAIVQQSPQAVECLLARVPMSKWPDADAMSGLATTLLDGTLGAVKEAIASPATAPGALAMAAHLASRKVSVRLRVGVVSDALLRRDQPATTVSSETSPFAPLRPARKVWLH